MGARAKVGIEWNILEGGLLTRTFNLKKLENDRQIFELESELESRQQNYPYQYNQLIWAFNNKKAELLEERVQFLKRMVSVKTELYHAHDLAYAEVLECKKKLEESKVLLTTYQGFNLAYETEIGKEDLVLDADLLPIVEIDLNYLSNDEARRNILTHINELKKSNLDLTNKTQTDLRLRVFGNYNYSADEFLPKNNFASFGISTSVPIRLGQKARKDAQQIEKQLLEEDIKFEFYNNSRELMNLYQEYNYKLKQYITFLHKKEDLEEKIRVENVLLKDTEYPYSPMRALKCYDTKMEVEMELIDLKQTLYLYLLKMFARSFHPEFKNCLRILEFEQIEQKLLGKRYLVFTIQDVKGLDTKFYINYLKKNEFETILLPTSSDLLWADVFKRHGFKVYLERPEGMPKPKNENIDGFFSMEINNLNYNILWSKATEENQELVKVANQDFQNRNELEYWILVQNTLNPKLGFLFTEVRSLINMEKAGLAIK